MVFFFSSLCLSLQLERKLTQSQEQTQDGGVKVKEIISEKGIRRRAMARNAWWVQVVGRCLTLGALTLLGTYLFASTPL